MVYYRKISNDSDISQSSTHNTNLKSCPQKRGCSSLVVRDELTMSTENTSSTTTSTDIASTSTNHNNNNMALRIPTIKLHKIDNQNVVPKHFDFNAIAVVKLKRLWQELPCPKQGKNLLTNGIIKNTKRMRFQTKTIILEDED